MTLKNKLSGKKIIFFSVQTFNLEKAIKEKMESFGANVCYYDERPSNSNFTKGIIRLKRSLYNKRIEAYYNSILQKTKHQQFDYLFVNRGEVIPEFFLIGFRKSHPHCVFIFYTWDSFTNHSHPTTLLQHFDKKFTFDPEDSKKYSLEFRPLFYLDAFKNLVSESIEYDLLFMGTAHSDRYRISQFILSWVKEKRFAMFCYYYMHGRLVYLYKKLFDKTFKQFDYKKLSFVSLSANDIVHLYKRSNVILDINHPHQKGLTMRTFEAIGAQRKLITTNKELAKFPFYSPNNVYFIDRENIVLDEAFFSNHYQDIDQRDYHRLSLEGWLHTIFVDSETEYWDKCK